MNQSPLAAGSEVRLMVFDHGYAVRVHFFDEEHPSTMIFVYEDIELALDCLQRIARHGSRVIGELAEPIRKARVVPFKPEISRENE